MTRIEFPHEVRRGSVTVKIYRTPTRGCDSYTLSYWQDGRRKRPTFSDFPRAKREAEMVARQLASAESGLLELTSADRSAYLRALQLLKPSGTPIEVAAAQFAEAKKALGEIPLSKAAEFYRKRHPQSMVPRRVEDVVTEMLETKKRDGMTDRYIQSLGYHLAQFATAIDCHLTEVAGPEIDSWLHSLSVAPRTRNNLRNSVRTLFSFAKGRGYLPKDHDELDGVPLAKDRGGEIEIFSPAEMAELLACSRPHLIPFLALGAFAGVRHAEIQRLGWDDLKLQDGIIEVRAAAAKTASRRTIPILDNLKAWLLPHWKPGGLVCRHKNMTDQLMDLVNEVGVRRKETKAEGAFSWKHNGLRHSFISYRVAKTQNVAQVALEAGNSPQMIFRHYRELVRPADAEKWFAISPGASENVIALAKASKAA